VVIQAIANYFIVVFAQYFFDAFVVAVFDCRVYFIFSHIGAIKHRNPI